MLVVEECSCFWKYTLESSGVKKLEIISLLSRHQGKASRCMYR